MKATIDERALRAEVTRLLKQRWLRLALPLIPAHALSGWAWWITRDALPLTVALAFFFSFFFGYTIAYQSFPVWARLFGIEAAYLRGCFARRYPPHCAERRLVLNLLREQDIELFMAILQQGERVGDDAPAATPIRGVNLSLPFPPDAPPPTIPPSLETTSGVIPLQPETRKGNE